jgi:excisionase family DNA binding protein
MLDGSFISIPEVAKALGISRISAYRYAETGTIPSIKLGSRRLVPAVFVENLAAKAFAAESPATSEGA